jgi:hypothetical protein
VKQISTQDKIASVQNLHTLTPLTCYPLGTMTLVMGCIAYRREQ